MEAQSNAEWVTGYWNNCEVSKSRIDIYRFNEGLTEQYLDQKIRRALKKKMHNCLRWIQGSSNASCEEYCQENEYWSCNCIKRNDIRTLYVAEKMPFKDWLKSSYSEWLLAGNMLLFLQKKIWSREKQPCHFETTRSDKSRTCS